MMSSGVSPRASASAPASPDKAAVLAALLLPPAACSAAPSSWQLTIKATTIKVSTMASMVNRCLTTQLFCISISFSFEAVKT